MTDIHEIESYPEISFIEETTLEDLKDGMVNDFAQKYQELTGKAITLGDADPNRLLLYACSLQIYQGFQWLDRAGKQSFLKYAYGDYLENVGALKGITRISGTYAQTTIKFTLSEAQTQAITIPMGTRVTANDGVYFYTVKDDEIKPGDTEIEINATCTEKGTVGNNYYPGKLNMLVDLIPYVERVENVTVSQGGSDEESDENLRERIFLAPSSYSVAGPGDAYAYWVKTFNPSVLHVKVTTPEPTVVDIRFIMEDGALPTDTTVEEMLEYLSSDDIRPLTDQVLVAAPDIEKYSIDVKYYINYSDRRSSSTIQSAVNQAIDNFIFWQREEIGRDINPSELIRMMVNAGAKRVEVQEPLFKVIPETSLAILDENAERVVIYGGIEDD